MRITRGRYMERLATFCLYTLTMFATARAQEFRASISGEVRDSTAAQVADVKVTARHQASNLTYEALSNESGRYVLNFLQPGDYTITAERAGFKKFVRDGVKLLLSDRASLDITLDVGSLSESVNVTGTALLMLPSELGTDRRARLVRHSAAM